MWARALYFVLIVTALAVWETGPVAAAGRGGSGSHSGGKVAAGSQSGNAFFGAYGTSGQFLRAENGIFGPTWFNPVGGWGYGGYGCGGYGYGWGSLGWGYSPGAYGYNPGEMPYLAMYPPADY